MEIIVDPVNKRNCSFCASFKSVFVIVSRPNYNLHAGNIEKSGEKHYNEEELDSIETEYMITKIYMILKIPH